jgi:hypothetical protein
MKKIVLTFGVIGGLVSAVLMLSSLPFEDKIGTERGYIIGYTTIVLSFLTVYFGIRSYRNNVGEGRITFGRAFAVGVLISLITCVFYVATWEVMFHFFMPDFMTKYTAQQIAKVRASGATEAVIQAKTADLERAAVAYNNPLVNVAMTLLEPLPVGLLITLISATVLRKAGTRDQGSGTREGRGTEAASQHVG